MSKFECVFYMAVARMSDKVLVADQQYQGSLGKIFKWPLSAPRKYTIPSRLTGSPFFVFFIAFNDYRDFHSACDVALSKS